MDAEFSDGDRLESDPDDEVEALQFPLFLPMQGPPARVDGVFAHYGPQVTANAAAKHAAATFSSSLSLLPPSPRDIACHPRSLSLSSASPDRGTTDADISGEYDGDGEDNDKDKDEEYIVHAGAEFFDNMSEADLDAIALNEHE